MEGGDTREEGRKRKGFRGAVGLRTKTEKYGGKSARTPFGLGKLVVYSISTFREFQRILSDKTEQQRLRLSKINAQRTENTLRAVYW